MMAVTGDTIRTVIPSFSNNFLSMLDEIHIHDPNRIIIKFQLGNKNPIGRNVMVLSGPPLRQGRIESSSPSNGKLSSCYIG